MTSETPPASYRSPKHKLLRFFEKSRDKWKDRCKESKDQIRYYRNRTQFLEESKKEYKQRAIELEGRVKELELALNSQAAVIEELKKKA